MIAVSSRVCENPAAIGFYGGITVYQAGPANRPGSGLLLTRTLGGRTWTTYTITPSIDGTFIILKVKGSITRRTAMRLNLEAHALGKQLQVRRYLVDVTEAKNTDNAMESYEFAYSDMQKMEGLDKYACVATLVSPNDHSHDFIETVSRNAGLNVRIFTDLDQAMRFLMNNLSPNRTTASDS